MVGRIVNPLLNDTFASVFDAKTYNEVARLAVGQGGANSGFTRDGTTGGQHRHTDI